MVLLNVQAILWTHCCNSADVITFHVRECSSVTTTPPPPRAWSVRVVAFVLVLHVFLSSLSAIHVFLYFVLPYLSDLRLFLFSVTSNPAAFLG